MHLKRSAADYPREHMRKLPASIHDYKKRTDIATMYEFCHALSGPSNVRTSVTNRNNLQCHRNPCTTWADRRTNFARHPVKSFPWTTFIDHIFKNVSLLKWRLYMLPKKLKNASYFACIRQHKTKSKSAGRWKNEVPSWIPLENLSKKKWDARESEQRNASPKPQRKPHREPSTVVQTLPLVRCVVDMHKK